MSLLIDQAERDRFVQQHGLNISVIAPAGVGKTHAIVDRIVLLASDKDEAKAIDRLTRLIVVTYSVRAAQDMQQRARAALRKANVSSRVQRAFQQTFFGTIHSYCVRILERFGHYLGLPSSVGLLQADDEVWNRFLIRGLNGNTSLSASSRELFHFYAPNKLYALGREISPGIVIDPGPFPLPNCQPLLDFRDNALHASTRKSIERSQAALRRWSESWARGDRFHPLPACPSTQAAPDFTSMWAITFEPLHEWLRVAALAFGRTIANAYEGFRLSEAKMTYDDQVRTALRVLQHPAVQRELAADHVSVLLDEAQDTDPRQFEVLLRAAGLRHESGQTADQSFAIVGDFQQAIYAPRSDLTTYRRVHDEISVEPRGARSELKVTFRCDRAIIDFVNRIFPSVLDNTAGQARFVGLVARDDAGPGQVARWSCPDEPAHAAGSEIKADVRSRHEAAYLARRLKELGPKGFGARDWSKVAILCPRKNWLLDIQRELLAVGLPVQLHSSSEQQRDRTPGTWLTALIWIAAHPEDSFEIAGVLREIFGISDHDMAIYTDGDGEKLRLDQPRSEGEGIVEKALTQLREICAHASSLPLDQFIRQLVNRTQLRERLSSLPEGDSDQELDDMLALILARCANGVLLSELADELHLGLMQVYPAEEEIRDAIQLLTSHKSKGLEWPVVILPYLFRLIESKSSVYPRLVQGEGGLELVCRDKTDFATQAKDFVTSRERQQLQRLLYVMCTRAKQSLILLDDEILFQGSRRRAGWSAGELLNLTGGVNRITWEALPEELISLPLSTEEPSITPALSQPLPTISAPEIEQAVTHSKAIPRRITPHALAIHTPHELEPEVRFDREEPPLATNPGILYGTWWHELVQVVPWSQPRAAWEKKFTAALLSSPQPERAHREWELFCASDLARWLAQPDILIQSEIPFLWRESSTQCMEGVIDLAVYSRADSTWRVIDWKTNRVGAAGGHELIDVYRQQIEAYVRMLAETLSAEVKGSLYLTQTGEWLDIG